MPLPTTTLVNTVVPYFQQVQTLLLPPVLSTLTAPPTPHTTNKPTQHGWDDGLLSQRICNFNRHTLQHHTSSLFQLPQTKNRTKGKNYSEKAVEEMLKTIKNVLQIGNNK